MAKVVRLIRYREKGDPGTEVPEAALIKDAGMEGNRVQGGERQLCLLTRDARSWMRSQTEPGLCFARFKENILTDGIALNELKTGCRLSVGEAILGISEESKHCHDACVFYIRREDCRLSQCVRFAVVLESGVARPGDPIRVLGAVVS